MIASTNVAGIVLIAAGAVLVIGFLALFALRHRSKGKRPEVPGAMRPGPSDQALETRQLLKLQGWGVVLITFFVLWFPVMWLLEPGRNLQQEEALRTDSIARGEAAVHPFSEENQLGVGCVRCHGPELHGGVIQAQGTYGYPPNLTTICGGPFVDPPHSQITSVDDIYTVIEQGRLDMPSWSIRYQGALNDQQINDIVNYLVWLSSKDVPYKDNVCINPDAAKAAASPSASASASASASSGAGS